MRTYLLAWNPRNWEWTDFDVVVERTAKGERVATRWSTGNNKSIAPGDTIFLLRQATDRGIIATGRATSMVTTGPHWDGSSKLARFVDVEFEVALAPSDVLPVETLAKADIGINWNRIQASGIHIDEQAAARLNDLWRQHLVEMNRRLPVMPEEVMFPARYVEGAVHQVYVNSYERNQRARELCIAHHGTACAVCGFSFRQKYGQIGDGFVHVHHLRDLSTIRVEYEVNPITDLRPVCPNCHAMLHVCSPAMSLEALQRVIAQACNNSVKVRAGAEEIGSAKVEE